MNTEDAEIIENDKVLLIESSLEMIKFLLLSQTEFYPISYIIDLNDKIKPIAFYDGNENPHPEKLILDFLDIFIDKADKNEIKACSIAYDVKIKRDNSIDFVDAIAIKFIHILNPNMRTFYYSYKINQNKLFEILDNWE